MTAQTQVEKLLTDHNQQSPPPWKLTDSPTRPRAARMPVSSGCEARCLQQWQGCAGSSDGAIQPKLQGAAEPDSALLGELLQPGHRCPATPEGPCCPRPQVLQEALAQPRGAQAVLRQQHPVQHHRHPRQTGQRSPSPAFQGPCLPRPRPTRGAQLHPPSPRVSPGQEARLSPWRAAGRSSPSLRAPPFYKGCHTLP